MADERNEAAPRPAFASRVSSASGTAPRVFLALALACALLAVGVLGQTRHARASTTEPAASSAAPAAPAPLAPIPLVAPPDRGADLPALRRGARLFATYCIACHDARLVRRADLRDLGLDDADLAAAFPAIPAIVDVPADALATDSATAGAHRDGALRAAMSAADARQAFGVTPPDLSLVARARGRAWVYTYLRSFYSDPDRPMGANNLLVPDVAMPDVLVGLHGVRTAVFTERTRAPAQGGTGGAHGDVGGVGGAASAVSSRVFMRFAQDAPGSLSPAAYDDALADLTAYLGWMAEPVERQRHRLGVAVVGFLLAFSFAAWRLLRAYRPTGA